ncbi:unnamed protein product [Acanthoscelides obtectus]|uniref:Uncharacterized protein n=1 Tax=Acanthoscelides obtectus TaxID=200917 RepID=A0A9P0K6T0_ACAOB|nr:unnamed protein product [Acanthoscelides obtectus]CAK1683171.1 UPF0488 protein CG14286 [Acanthoscelides obtectus]
MPPKPKLYRDKDKGKSKPKISQTNPEQVPGPSSAMTSEQEQQFQVELCWCIQQLQIALQSGKLNNKQVKDHTNALNTLMNNSAPLIKKRQIMRLSFGDYRAKMALEEKKSKNQMVINVKPAIPSKKSTFFKKSGFSTTGNSFRFNFDPPIETSGETIINDPSKTELTIQQEVDPFYFKPSDNSFRFNFVTENEKQS